MDDITSRADDDGRFEQRKAYRDSLRGERHTRSYGAEWELRDIPNGMGGSDLLFTGYACVTCRDHNDDSAAYEMEDMFGTFTESVVRGAFTKTLSQNADVAFLLNHDGITLARTKPGTLKLAEDDRGLHTEARLDPSNPVVQQIRSGVERGDLDEMSFAFRPTRQEWSEDYDRRWLTEVNIHQGDVSVVNYGANPHTAGLVSVRSSQPTEDEVREALMSHQFDRAALDVMSRAVGFDLRDMAVDLSVVETEPEPEPAGPTSIDIARAVQRSRELERKYRRKSA